MANRSSRDPGEIEQIRFSGRVSEDVPSYAVNTGAAAVALAAVAGSLSERLMKLADKAAAREGAMAGLSAGQASGASSLQAMQVAGEAGAAAMTGPWHEQAKALLRKEEGFRDTPYWDVTAHRVGYGSDTTIVDGKSVKVTQGMKITRAQAEADLDYRLNSREGKVVRQQLGAAWETLPDTARAALMSVGYNYGSLPKNVVDAARTGDLGQLSNAVGSLPANPARRRREARMIMGAMGAAPGEAAPQGGSQGAAPKENAPASGPAPEQPLSTTPLALRRDGTIRGDAFDQAALSAWGWRVQEGVSQGLFAAHQNYGDDPVAFQKATADLRKQFADELPNDPQAREMFDKSFVDQSSAYVRDVAARHEAKLRQEQEASYTAGLSARQVDLERQALVLGASPDGDAIIGKQVQSVQASIDGAVQQGIITPKQAQQAKEDVALSAARGRIQGVYDALPSPDQKEAYARSLLEDWKTGQGPLAALPYASVKAVSDKLWNDARNQVTAKTVANETERLKLTQLIDDDVASIAAGGKGLTSESGLTVAAVEQFLGPDDLVKWRNRQDTAQKLFVATNGMEKQSPDAIRERLELLRPEKGRVGYAEQMEIYDAAVKHADGILKARSQDPLQAASEAGIVKLEPIDASSPDALSKSMQVRDSQSRLVSEIYGGSQQMFTKAEVGAIAGMLQSTDPDRQAVALSQVDYLANAKGPEAVRSTFNEDTFKRLQDWQSKVRYLAPDEARKWLEQRSDPQWQERVRPLVTKGEGEARKVGINDIIDGFDDAWRSDPAAPIDEATQRALQNDFVTLYGEKFAVSQDNDDAKKQALEALKLSWGKSSVFGGGGRVMLYPPEKYYPSVAGGHDYIRSEIEGLASSRSVPASNLGLVSDAKTEAAAKRGQRPGYLVTYIDPKTGLEEMMTDEAGRPLRHFFDADKAQEKAFAAGEAKRRTANDPWMVLSDGTAIGPLYPFGANKADLDQRAKRIPEILKQQKRDGKKIVDELTGAAPYWTGDN